VNGLSQGEHRSQCCIHPWMRVTVDVKDQAQDQDHDPNTNSVTERESDPSVDSLFRVSCRNPHPR